MKLYVVTAGCYSDYHICGIFESEEKAKLYVKLNKSSNDYCDEDMDYHCEETLDDRLMDANDSRNLYSVDVYPDTGKMKAKEMHCHHLTPDPDLVKFHEHLAWDMEKRQDITVYCIYVLAYNKDHALKIAQDKYAEYKAEKAGII